MEEQKPKRKLVKERLLLVLAGLLFGGLLIVTDAYGFDFVETGAWIFITFFMWVYGLYNMYVFYVLVTTKADATFGEERYRRRSKMHYVLVCYSFVLAIVMLCLGGWNTYVLLKPYF